MKRIILMLTVAALLVVALTVTAPSAFAKITPAQPASCENNSGTQPGGQQPNCKGQGLTQNPPTCAENPTGKCPKGQN